MKITDIKVRGILLPVAPPEDRFPPMPWWHDYIEGIVEVHTDEGIVGLSATATIPEYFSHLLAGTKKRWIGEDPFCIENIIGDTYYRFSEVGWVASVIEIACWDIIGKKLHQPVYNLLGGKIRDKAQVTRFLGVRPPEQAAKDAAEAMKKWGIQSFKLKIGNTPSTDIQVVKAVREAVGDEAYIRCDANGCYSTPTAINQARKLLEFSPQFFEDPTNTIEGIKRVREAVGIPVCMCGAAFSVAPTFSGNHSILMRIIKEDATDFVHIDPFRTHGLLGWKKMDGMCAAAGIQMVNHWVYSGVSVAAALQGIAISRTCDYAHDLIVPAVPPGPEEDILTKPFTIENGAVKIPDGPGLGIELDEKKMAKAEERYRDRIKKTGSDAVAPYVVPDQRYSFGLPRGTDRRGGIPDNW
jgi:glucarate dehydratase